MLNSLFQVALYLPSLQGGKVEVLDENGTVIESYATKGSFNELELLSPIYYYPVCPAPPEILWDYTIYIRNHKHHKPEAFSTKGSFNELELLSPTYYYPVRHNTSRFFWRLYHVYQKPCTINIIHQRPSRRKDRSMRSSSSPPSTITRFAPTPTP